MSSKDGEAMDGESDGTGARIPWMKCGPLYAFAGGCESRPDWIDRPNSVVFGFGAIVIIRALWVELAQSRQEDVVEESRRIKGLFNPWPPKALKFCSPAMARFISGW